VEAGLSQEIQRLRTRFNDSIKDTMSRIDRCEAKTSELQLITSDVSQFAERSASNTRDELQHLASQLTAADSRLSHDLRVATGIFEVGREEVVRSMRVLERSVGEAVDDVKKEHSALQERVDASSRNSAEDNNDMQAKAVAAAKAAAEQVAALEGGVRGLKESLAAKIHDVNKLIAANDLRCREGLEQVSTAFTVTIESTQSTLALNAQRLAELERVARDDAARAQRGISEAQAELTALIGVGHSETKIKVSASGASSVVCPSVVMLIDSWQVAALEAAVLQLDQKIEKTGATAATAAAAASAATAAAERVGNIKTQQHQPQATATPSSPALQSDLLRACSDAERALKTASALEGRVQKLETSAEGLGSLSAKVAVVELAVTRVQQQQEHDVRCCRPCRYHHH
jgi:hypothetical protein